MLLKAPRSMAIPAPSVSRFDDGFAARIRRIPLKAFPRVPMWTDFRNNDYATAMIDRNSRLF
jgi:hypothetical protein